MSGHCAGSTIGAPGPMIEFALFVNTDGGSSTSGGGLARAHSGAMAAIRAAMSQQHARLHRQRPTAGRRMVGAPARRASRACSSAERPRTSSTIRRITSSPASPPASKTGIEAGTHAASGTNAAARPKSRMSSPISTPVRPFGKASMVSSFIYLPFQMIVAGSTGCDELVLRGQIEQAPERARDRVASRSVASPQAP